MTAPGAVGVNNLRGAGVHPDEVNQWVSVRAARLREGGASQQEIAEYFGALPQPDGTATAEWFGGVLESIPAEKREATTFMEALETGLETSVSGLLKRGKLPDLSIPEDAPALVRIGAGLGTVAGDLPAMIPAAVAASPGGPAGSFAAAFAVPAAIRVPYMQKLQSGEVRNFSEFWDMFIHSTVETAKAFTVGAATGVVGSTAKALGAPMLVPQAAEVATMVSAGAALDGRVPKPEEFLDAAVIVGVLHGTMSGVRATPQATRALSTKFRKTYAIEGDRPSDVIAKSVENPTITEDLLSVNMEVPRGTRDAGEAILRASEEARAKTEPVAVTEKATEPVQSPHPEPVQTVLDRISVGDRDARGRGATLDDIYTQWFDRFHPLGRVVEAMRGDKELSVTEDAARLAQLNIGVTARADHFLEFSPLDFKTLDRVGRPLKEIFAPIAKDPAKLDQWRAYAMAKASLELAARDKPIETGIDPVAARETVRLLRNDMEPIWAEAREYQNHTLAYLRDSGVINKQQFDLMQEANKDYSPMFRVFEDAEGSGAPPAGRGLRNPVKKKTGGDQRIVDPLESIIKNTYVYITLAERNTVRRALVDLAETAENGADFARKQRTPKQRITVTKEELRRLLNDPALTDADKAKLDAVFDNELAVFRPGSMDVDAKDGTFNVFRDGKREVWRTDPEVAKAFEDANNANALLRILGAPARTLRAGAILTPEFVLRNPIRDQFTAFVYSKAGFRPWLDLTAGIYHLAKKDALYQDWLKSGGPMATMVALDRQYLQHNIRQVMGQTGWPERARNVVLSPIEALRIASEFAEQGTRLGEFARVGKKQAKGKTVETTERGKVLERGEASRQVSLDFGRMGFYGQHANRLVPFFNASLQASDKMVREMRDHPARFAAKVGATITLPSIALHLMNRQDPDYYRIPQWQRDLFWLIPMESKANLDAIESVFKVHVGDKVWLRFPKPFELGIIFGTAAERMVDTILEDDPTAFDGFAATLMRGATPGVIPQALLPFGEHFANRSVFRDRPLIPQSVEGRLPDFQAAPYTTETTRALGHLIAKLPAVGDTNFASPPVIENYIRQWTAGLGIHVLNLSDAALRKAAAESPKVAAALSKVGVAPERPRGPDMLSDIPFVKAFAVRFPSGDAQPLTDFWDRYGKHEQIRTTLNDLLDDPDPAVRAEAKDLLERNPRGLANIKGMAETVRIQAKIIRNISLNPALDVHEKGNAIDTIRFQQIHAAEIGLAQMEQLGLGERR